MRLYLIIFAFFFSIHLGFSQAITGIEYKNDLSLIYDYLKKSSSYKTQKSQWINVEQKYNSLISNFPNNMYAIDAFKKYYELLDEIKDYHNSISSNSKLYNLQDLNDPKILDEIRNRSSGYFKTSTLDLDSLETDLTKRALNDYEGIYWLGNLLKVGLYRSTDSFVGVILESKISSWKKAEEIFYLIPKENDRFRMITGSITDKRILSSLEGFHNGTFLTSGWKKKNAPLRYYNSRDTAKFDFKKLRENVDYIKVSNFGTSNSSFNKAIRFYDSLKSRPFESNIILDLSKNTGGGERNSNHLYKLLKTHKGNFYILTSFYTVSHAEQFTLKMKKLPNVFVLGERTIGILTYGSNFGHTQNSSTGRFIFMFTDLKDNWSKFLPYEGKGIQPDYNLDISKNFVDQTLDIISKKP